MFPPQKYRPSIRSVDPRFLLFLGLTSLAVFSFPAFAEITEESITKTEDKVREVARKALPCTVALIPAGKVEKMGSGSGVIVKEYGLILTAAHVTMEMGEEVTVIFPDGKRVPGKVLGSDFSRDSGMVQITVEGEKFPFVELGDSKTLKENDWTIAMGHAGGFDKERTPPVRLGRVLYNDENKFITTDSTLIGGDSGGPLFDEEGKLIGIHSNIGFSLSQNNHVPISTFIDNWDRLEKGDRFGGKENGGLLENPERPTIGAALRDAPDGEGAVVSNVISKSPAEKAGVKKGDKIIRVEDEVMQNSAAVTAAIRKRKAGDSLRFTVESGEETKELTIELTAIKNLPSARSSSKRIAPFPQRSPREKKELQDFVDEKMRESIEKREMLITEEEMKRFSNAREFNYFLNRFKLSLSPEQKKELARLTGQEPAPEKPKQVRPGEFDPDEEISAGDGFFRDVLNAFRPSVSEVSDSIHLVFRGQEWKSLCTVVHEDGYVITKASEIEKNYNQALTVMLSKDKNVPAKVVKNFPDHDLALLKLEDVSGLTPISWDTRDIDLPLGSFLSAAGSGPDPVAIGLVSVKPRSFFENKGFLGIGMAPDKKGVKVTSVLPGGGAGNSGIKKGDIITKIDQIVCDSPEILKEQINKSKPGTAIILHFLRGNNEAATRVTLTDRSALKANANMRMNRMGTEVSATRSGFRSILQTDLPILPQQCGGPVVDLEGNVIGLNIARAGRIKTFAIPAADIHELLEPEISRIEAMGKSTNAEPAVFE